jgi:hypothetical protein
LFREEALDGRLRQVRPCFVRLKARPAEQRDSNL